MNECRIIVVCPAINRRRYLWGTEADDETADVIAVQNANAMSWFFAAQPVQRLKGEPRDKWIARDGECNGR